jgi:hypothetical protein
MTDDVTAETTIPVMNHEAQNAVLVQPIAIRPSLRFSIFSLIISSYINIKTQRGTKTV